jgi:TetR/AcrR family transcriptional repressor of nem operon
MANETADRILDCAEALMTERGFSGFSYADISDEVKVTKASIHFHFATKALLVQRVLARYRERTRQGLQQLSQAPGAMARLQAYVGYWENCIRAKAPSFCVCALLAAEIPTLPDEVSVEVRGHFNDLWAWLKATLEAGKASGEVQLAQDAAAEAQLLLASVHGAMLAARAGAGAGVFASVAGGALARLELARQRPAPRGAAAKKAPRRR